tara:strand:+ start:109 stop:1905 length:1797 start_codon:yes stop_codon:yes gene_type:complete
MNELNRTLITYSIRNNLLIFLGTAFFAVHTLAYIIYFKLNFPHGDDIDYTLRIAHEYAKTGQFPFSEFISSASSHLTYSLKLISLPNLLWNSFDVVNFYYLQWILMSLTLFFLFLIIKRTSKSLFWVLIPISAFVYCPIFITGYFVFSTVMWLSVSLCISIVVYLVTTKKITPLVSTAAISVAVYSSFFNLIGLMAWLPGIISFLRKDSEQKRAYKKWLIPWIICASIFGIIFLSLAPSIANQSKLDLFFSLDGLSFVVTYLATSYRFGTENIVLSKIIGFITLLLCGYLFYFFWKINKENFQKAYPWLLLIIISIVTGMYIAIGRMDLGYHDGNESFYKTISFFSQIGILVLFSMILLEIKKNARNRMSYVKIGLIILIIVSQMIFLIPSYYAGWVKGDYYFQEKMAYVNCYSLTHGSECLIAPPFHGMAPAFERGHYELEFFNFLAENQLGIFGEMDFNQQNRHDLNEFRGILENNSDIESGFGKIEKINGKLISEHSIVIEESFVNIEGWILDKNKMSVNSIFLMIDNKPLLKYDDFIYRENIKENNVDVSESNSYWNIIFLSGYIEKGCHEITIIGLSNETLVKLEQKIELCRI